MDHHQDETTTFEVTVTSDGVSTSGISASPQIVLDTHNTLSWGINECSSSFQSVSSCETLESYEHNALNTEAPQVIVVPFLDDHVTDTEITETVLTNNDVHIPVIKECSIRIDQLEMSSAHCGATNVEKIIELPFSTNCSTSYTAKTPPFYLSDDDSSVFEGFGVESIVGTQYELYKKAVSLIKKNVAHVERISEHNSTEPIVTEQQQPLRQPPEKSTKHDTVKRPRQIQRKISKPQLSETQNEPINQSRIEHSEINPTTSKQNNTVETVPIPDRVSSTPVKNVDMKSNRQDNSNIVSSDSDSDVVPADVTNSATKKKTDASADIKNNNKQKELRKLEKMRRRKELSLVADKIRDHWRETFAAAAKRKQRNKARKNKQENNKHKNHYTKHDFIQDRGQRKRKRISCSSDSDSSDSSNTSRTSCSSSLSDSESNNSDTTHASDTSYTSHTRTESDSTDSESDSSDSRHRYRHRYSRRTRSPSATSDTSDTSSSDDTGEKRRNFHLLRKAMYRKQSKSKSNENRPRSRTRKAFESYRSEESLPNRKKMTKDSERALGVSKKTKKRTIFSQKQQKFDQPSRSSTERVTKIKSEFAERSGIESTSAGDFSVKQCCFD